MFKCYVLAFLALTPASALAQDFYVNGNLSAYSYGYKYKDDYPLEKPSYTDYSPSTNQSVGFGLVFFQKNYFEFSVSKIAYRYHYPTAFSYPKPSTTAGCLCLSASGFSYFENDNKSSTNLNLTYKYGILWPRHFNVRRNFQVFGVVGITAQVNPKIEAGVFDNVGDQILYNGDTISFKYSRTDKVLPVVSFGLEAEKALLKNLYLWGSFRQYIGFSAQMRTSSFYTKNGVLNEGMNYGDGTARSFSLGLRYYIPSSKLVEKGLTSSNIQKGFFYAGLDFGSFKNKQETVEGKAFTYVNFKLERENSRFNGIIVGYRQAHKFYEFGLYVLPDNIGYMVESGLNSNSINYTSQSYLYMPVRYKYGFMPFASAKSSLEIIPSVGISTSFYLPPEFRSNEIAYLSPDQTFKKRAFVFGTEVGTELAWYFGRFSLVGYIRYLYSPQNARQVEFSGVVNNKQVWGTLVSNHTGFSSGIGMRYLFKKKLAD